MLARRRHSGTQIWAARFIRYCTALPGSEDIRRSQTRVRGQRPTSATRPCGPSGRVNAIAGIFLIADHGKATGLKSCHSAMRRTTPATDHPLTPCSRSQRVRPTTGSCINSFRRGVKSRRKVGKTMPMQTKNGQDPGSTKDSSILRTKPYGTIQDMTKQNNVSVTWVIHDEIEMHIAEKWRPREGT